MSIDRRRFLKGTLLGAASAAAAPLSGVLEASESARHFSADEAPSSSRQGLVVDTNVHLFEWPFRALKHAGTSSVVKKLRKHGIRRAWAGSYEALFHKNIDRVNARLAEACHEQGEGLLLPFGTVNPRWPDWEEDLRRADETYDMPGIRLYPGYQNYELDLPEFKELVVAASERGLIVQIAVDQEDERMQHPRIDASVVDVTPLPTSLMDAPEATVQLLNPFRHARGERLRLMVEETDVLFGTSNLDGTGAIERIMAGKHWYLGDVKIPASRLMVGSHMPFRPVESALLQLVESELSSEDADAIMFANAERLLPHA